MGDDRELYVSPSGDRWVLLRDPVGGEPFVRHTGNPASGGHVSDLSASAFLVSGQDGPEHQALRLLMPELADEQGAPVVFDASSDDPSQAERLGREAGTDLKKTASDCPYGPPVSPLRTVWMRGFSATRPSAKRIRAPWGRPA